MNIEQALEIIKNACASINTNLQNHQQIQKAIEVVQGEIEHKKR